MNFFKGNGSTTKCTHSKQDKSCPEWTIGPHDDDHITRWVAFSSQAGELLQQSYAYLEPRRESAPRVKAEREPRNILEVVFCKEMCQQCNPKFQTQSLQKNRARLLIRNNQRAVCMGVWTSTDGAKSKLSTFDCFFDLWRLTTPKEPSYFKKEKGVGKQAEKTKHHCQITGPDSSVPVSYSRTL